MPSYLTCLNDEEAVLFLVRARWNEHMIEDVIIANHSRVSKEGYQNMLMRHKLARARLETQIYTLAIEQKQKQLEAIASKSTEIRSKIEIILSIILPA